MITLKNDFEKHLYEIETLGFTIIKQVVSEDDCSRMKKLIDLELEKDYDKYGKYSGKSKDLIVDLISTNNDFLSIIENDVFFKMFSLVLGEENILYSYTSTILRPKVYDAVQNIHVDSYKFIPGFHHGLLATIALDDFTDQNGATLYLAGSQHLEDKPSDETFNTYSLSTSRKKGDVIFFNPRVWHKAGYNNTDFTRYAMTIYATRPFIKQRFDFTKMLSENYLKPLSERMIKFLGFNSIPPVSVDEYYSSVKEKK